MTAKIIEFTFSEYDKVLRSTFQNGTFVKTPIQALCYDSKNKRYITGFSHSDNPALSTLMSMKDLSFKKSSIVKIVRNLELEHCNDMVYDKTTHKIYVVGGGLWIAIVNPETLQIEKKIPLQMYAWSLAQYNNGDFFIHDGSRGERYKHDFSSSTTISTYDRLTLVDILKVPYRPERNDYAGCWQGAIIIDNKPYMIFNEFSLKTDKPISFVLFSCEMGQDRTIYRAETNREVESACMVDNKMILAIGNYYYSGGEWEMAEMNMKMFNESYAPISVVADTLFSIDCSKAIPLGYILVSANVSFTNDTTTRELPAFNTKGNLIFKIVKIEKNRVYMKSSKDYNNLKINITGFCKKK